MNQTSNKFLKFPEYPGGSEALKKYFKENLKYPGEALTKEIEGTVYTMIEIDDNGNVIDSEVIKGLGYGCDEEAIRLVKNLRFGSVRNRKVRVKTKKRINVHFKLPVKPAIKFNYSTKKENPEQNNNSPKTGYSYTIQFKQ